MITGIGIDLVEIKRIKSILSKASIINRLFSLAEIRYCSRRKRAAESFAVRWAAKEAFIKALGSGWGAQPRPKWSEIAVLNNPKSGQPVLKLSGKARKFPVGKIHLSLTHTKHEAMALVILEKI